MKRFSFLLSGLLWLISATTATGQPTSPRMVAAAEADPACRAWVDSVMSGMSLRDRVCQLFVYTIAPDCSQANRNLLRRVVEDYRVGGLLFSGGRLADQARLTNEAQDMARVPLLLTFDGEWGLAMRLKQDAVSYPRNMVLGCITNDSLLAEYGLEVARQLRELGVQVNFAPVADVNINPRNPVIGTRSFGEHPRRVARQATAYAQGLERGGVLSVSKHFPGHGDTEVDSHKTLPTLDFSRQRLDSVELLPFRHVIESGLGGIMVGHLSVPAIEPEAKRPSSLSHAVVTGLLRQDLGFRGLVFTDALAMQGVGRPGTLCLQALKAGCDVLLVPRRIKEEVDALMEAIDNGELTQTEVDDHCRRVLTWKYALGLSRKPRVQLSGLDERISPPAARQLAATLRQAAVIVLANRGDLLPLAPEASPVAVVIVGSTEQAEPFVSELKRYARAVPLTLPAGADAAACRKLAGRLKGYRRVVVCVTTRKPGRWWTTFFEQWQPEVPAATVFFTPAADVNRLPEAIRRADAVVLAHSTDDDVQRHTARVLYGHATADGRLPAAIGDLFRAGTGVTIRANVRPVARPEEHGIARRWLDSIASIAREGLEEGAYPGCQIVVLKDGQEIYNQTFGQTTTTRSIASRYCPPGTTLRPRPVRPTDLYDLASLTKTTAILLAVMKLYDQGRLSLTDRVSDYLPYLLDTDKRDITIRQLLLHESGLPAGINFYCDAIDTASYDGPLYRGKQAGGCTVRIARKTWANPGFRFRPGLIADHPTDSCTLPVCDGLWLNPRFRNECYSYEIACSRLRSRTYRYSDVGFVLLQQVVEARTGERLDSFLTREFYRPMGLRRTTFLPLQRGIDRQDIIPSALDPFLRKTVLQGYVHDETAAFQGGVSGNAGLFSCAAEVARVYQMLLNGGELDGRRYLSRETVRLFTTQTSRNSRRGLGFDKPDPTRPAISPCAPSAPRSVYGHTGFTGTCAWADPDNRLVFVFLCNRTYPDPWNTTLTRLDLRTRMQEMLYRALRD